MKHIFLIVLFMSMGVSAFCQEHTKVESYVYPNDPQVLKKLTNWQDIKFGMIIHWGIYSQWGVIESWSLCPEDSAFIKRTGPYAQNWYEYKKAYENLQTTFNPEQFNPDIWAGLASQAGMKYVVFTTKHHDGFCMFDTKYTGYKITDPQTPFSTNPKSNITREVFEAFRNQGFIIGAYFSKPDWHSDNYWWPYFPPRDRNPSYDTKKYPDRWNAFKDFSYNQIEELMTGYGSIDILWLDGGQVRPPKQDIDMPRIASMARSHQPGILVVDRTVSGEFENYITPEQQIPEAVIPVPWETCMTIGESWSYKPNDVYKSASMLIHTLCDVVAKGGNLLLNVGPKPNGELDDEQAQRLREVGAWIKVNSEAIYGTRPIAPYREGNWAFTSKGKNVYAIYLPPSSGQNLPSQLNLSGIVPAKGSKIIMLGSSESIPWKVVDGGFRLNIPKSVTQNLPCKHAWVFKISSINK